MSIVIYLVFAILLAAGCFGSWQAALYWQNRTRNPRKEDPRDQEIRELSAALSIARKDADRLGKSSTTHDQEVTEIRIKLDKANDALADTRQKFNATKDTLNKEIEARSELDARLADMHRELNDIKSRNSELELRVKIDSPTSGLVAGLDDTVEDDEKEIFTIRHEHKVYKEQASELETSLKAQTADTDRWKQHCAVMTKTNKSLRASVDNLNQKLEDFDEIQERAGQLPGALEQVEQMRAELGDLRNVLSDNEKLQSQVAELDGQLQHSSASLAESQRTNESLQTTVTELSTVRDENNQLNTDLLATNELLGEAQSENQSLTARVEELSSVRDENTNLYARIDELQQIENENAELSSQLRKLSLEHETEIAAAKQTTEGLQGQLDALQAVQADIESENAELNTRLKQQSEELGTEISGARQEVETLRVQLDALQTAKAEIKSENAELNARLEQQSHDLGSEIASAKQETVALQEQLDAQLSLKADLETQNAKLDARSREQALEHETEAAEAKQEIDGLQVRLDALQSIEAENDRLLNETRELRSTHAAETQDYQNQLAALQAQQAESQDHMADLEEVARESRILRERILELERLNQAQNTANNELGARIEKLSGELKAAADQSSTPEKLESARQQMAELEKQLAESKRGHDSAYAENEVLKLQLAETSHLQAEIERQETQAEALKQSNSELASEIDELTDRLTKTQCEKETLQAELENRATRQEQRDLNGTATEALTEIAADEVPPSPPQHDNVVETGTEEFATEEQDDLKAIRGVGAKIEQKLNMLGILNFKALAELDAGDYERAAELIPNLEGRMKRDNWTEQARELHEKKYCETT